MLACLTPAATLAEAVAKPVTVVFKTGHFFGADYSRVVEGAAHVGQ